MISDEGTEISEILNFSNILDSVMFTLFFKALWD